MVQAKPRVTSFEDYLAYDDGTDRRYELTNGALVELPPESEENIYLARSLDRILSPLVGMRRVMLHGMALAVPGMPKNRYPDLTVLQPEHSEQMQALGSAAITLSMAPPLLVVEVVSPGETNRRRDYIEKRNQYEWRGVPEYWILDPHQAQVVVFSMGNNGYDETAYQGDDTIVSSVLPDLKIRASSPELRKGKSTVTKGESYGQSRLELTSNER